MNDILGVALIIIFCPLVYMVMGRILAYFSGWRTIAEQYPVVSTPLGKRYRMQSGRVSLIRYNNCLTIYASDTGLHIEPPFRFISGHPPIFLPWDCIHNRKESHSFWDNFIEFEIGSPPVGWMALPSKVMVPS